MKNTILAIAIIAALFLSSCKEKLNLKNTEKAATEVLEQGIDEIVTTISTNEKGEKLKIVFNNTNGTATLNLDGETIELDQQKSASGFWFKNATYELRGKGNDVVLKKDNKVIFEHEDEIIYSSYKNEKEETLDLTVNATTNKAKVYLNGGKQIELNGEKAASGIWFKNEVYELRGKGENLELTQNGKVVFKN